MIKLKPINHGKHDNLHVLGRKQSRKINLVFFFKSEEAHVLKITKPKPDVVQQPDKLYNEVVEACLEMGFELKTPRHRFFKQKFQSTEDLLKFINKNI